MRISFDFNPDTKKVTNLTVDDKGTTKKKTDNTTLVLSGTSLKLNDDALALLESTCGDRLCVRFNPNPVILTPETANEINGGNLVTKQKTISCKGKTSVELAKHGTEFTYTLKSKGYLVLNSKESGETEKEEMQVVLKDEDFNIPSLDEEVTETQLEI